MSLDSGIIWSYEVRHIFRFCFGALPAAASVGGRTENALVEKNGTEAKGFHPAMKPFTLATPLIILLVLPLGGSCKQAGPDGAMQPPGDQAQIVEIGSWGGEQVGLDVTQSGATVEFSCAHGSIEGSLVLDEEGSFTSDGLYFQEHGGPVNEKDVTEPVKARYEGKVTGGSMSLTVVNLDTQEKIGTYSLTFGAAAKITKCL
jgi:hypothetical protein